METGSVTFCDLAYSILRCSGLMSVRVCYWKKRKKKNEWKRWKFLQTWIFHDQLNLKDSACLGRPEKVFLYVHFGYFFFCLAGSADIKLHILICKWNLPCVTSFFFKERLNSAHVKNWESFAFSFKPLCTWWARITSLNRIILPYYGSVNIIIFQHSLSDF